MDFKTTTQPYLQLFYFTGLSSFYQERIDLKSLKSPRLVRRFIFNILCISVVIVISAIQYYLQITRKLKFYHNSFGIFFITIDCAIHILVVIISMRNTEAIMRLYSGFRELDRYMVAKGNRTVDYHRFHSRTVFSLACIILPMVVTLFVSRLIPSRLFTSTSENLQIISTLLYGVVQTQIVFYVVLFNNLINWFKCWIKHKAGSSFCLPIAQNIINVRRRDHSDHAVFRPLKYVHFKLWELSQNISMVFGWTLLLIIFRNWFTVGYNMYKVFLSLENLKGFETLARKYD